MSFTIEDVSLDRESLCVCGHHDSKHAEEPPEPETGLERFIARWIDPGARPCLDDEQGTRCSCWGFRVTRRTPS